MPEDHSKGQVKQMRGSGPPILTVEGTTIEIEAILYGIAANSYGSKEMPFIAQVIGIDLIRRTVRLQVLGSREILYCATHDQNGRDGSYWLFSTDESARRTCISQCAKEVKRAERNADEALDKLEKAKECLRSAEEWTPREWNV